MKKTYEITVHGRASRWDIPLEADPSDVARWRADGLTVDEVVEEIDAEVDRLAAEVLEMLGDR